MRDEVGAFHGVAVQLSRRRAAPRRTTASPVRAHVSLSWLISHSNPLVFSSAVHTEQITDVNFQREKKRFWVRGHSDFAILFTCVERSSIRDKKRKLVHRSFRPRCMSLTVSEAGCRTTTKRHLFFSSLQHASKADVKSQGGDDQVLKSSPSCAPRTRLFFFTVSCSSVFSPWSQRQRYSYTTHSFSSSRFLPASLHHVIVRCCTIQCFT